MSNYVEVLAVMDRNIVFAERTGSAEDLGNAREARAVVAELIETAADIANNGYGTASIERLRYLLARATGSAA